MEGWYVALKIRWELLDFQYSGMCVAKFKINLLQILWKNMYRTKSLDIF